MPRSSWFSRRRWTVLAVMLCGCPGGGGGAKKAPAPCKELAQPCEFEPGKLGACMYRANCNGPNCLYCQSQH